MSSMCYNLSFNTAHICKRDSALNSAIPMKLQGSQQDFFLETFQQKCFHLKGGRVLVWPGRATNYEAIEPEAQWNRQASILIELQKGHLLTEYFITRASQ